jgi:hypothetical protein
MQLNGHWHFFSGFFSLRCFIVNVLFRFLFCNLGAISVSLGNVDPILAKEADNLAKGAFVVYRCDIYIYSIVVFFSW